MIDINLMPVNQRKKSNGLFGVALNISREILLGIGAAVAALLITMHILLILVWGFKSIQLAGVEGKFKQLLPDKNIIDAVANEVKDVNKKMKAITGLISIQKTTWSEKFNVLSDEVPKGVWLSKVTVDPTTLIIFGMAASKQHNEITLVSGLTANLKNNQQLMVDIASIEVNAINRVKYNNTDVSQFTITVKLK